MFGTGYRMVLTYEEELLRQFPLHHSGMTLSSDKAQDSDQGRRDLVEHLIHHPASVGRQRSVATESRAFGVLHQSP